MWNKSLAVRYLLRNSDADRSTGLGWSPVVHSCSAVLCFLVDFPHDLRPGECRDAHLQPDRHDAAAVPLGRLSSVPRAHAAGLPLWLLGLAQQDGGTWSIRVPSWLQLANNSQPCFLFSLLGFNRGCWTKKKKRKSNLPFPMRSLYSLSVNTIVVFFSL